MLNPRKHNAAFTLVEILVVLVIISMMGGMVVTAVQGVTQTAREARTRSIIATIDSVLQDQYESYKYRPLSVEIPDLYRLSSQTGNEVGFEVLAQESARVRLMMLRDLQRMEMPDRLSDIARAPITIRAACNPVLIDPGPPVRIIGSRADLTVRRTFLVNWYNSGTSGSTATYASGSDNVPGRLASYRDRIPTTGFSFTAAPSLANQGAECLYLIMSTTYVAGTPAIDSIPAANIDDTDGDGLMEILDGWGRPLGFIRWPIGFADPEASQNTNVVDDFDTFRSDFVYAKRAVADATPPDSAWARDVVSNPDVLVRPWSVRPLVFSAGQDGDYGITQNPWAMPSGAGLLPIEDTDFSYADGTVSTWPADVDHMGIESTARAAAYQMVDPYLRTFIQSNLDSGEFAGLLPGQLEPRTDAVEGVSDNLTNYGLQVAR